MKPVVQNCKKCGAELVPAGFERRLIMRGKDKGKYIVTELVRCNHCKGK